jgi:hypothetical protein
LRGFVAFAMTILPLAIGRENFPGPPPLIEMAFPVHIALSALTGVELIVVSGYPHVPTRAQSALQQRLALRPSMAARSLLGV